MATAVRGAIRVVVAKTVEHPPPAVIRVGREDPAVIRADQVAFREDPAVIRVGREALPALRAADIPAAQADLRKLIMQ